MEVVPFNFVSVIGAQAHSSGLYDICKSSLKFDLGVQWMMALLNVT